MGSQLIANSMHPKRRSCHRQWQWVAKLLLTASTPREDHVKRVISYYSTTQAMTLLEARVIIKQQYNHTKKIVKNCTKKASK